MQSSPPPLPKPSSHQVPLTFPTESGSTSTSPPQQPIAAVTPVNSHGSSPVSTPPPTPPPSMLLHVTMAADCLLNLLSSKMAVVMPVSVLVLPLQRVMPRLMIKLLFWTSWAVFSLAMTNRGLECKTRSEVKWNLIERRGVVVGCGSCEKNWRWRGE